MAGKASEVGYKRPPQHSRFKKGQSGNPGGRPRKIPTLSSELEAELAENTQIEERGRELVVSKQRAMVKMLVSAALAGNMRAAASIIAIARTSTSPDESDSETQQLEREVLDRFINDEVNRRLEKDDSR